MTLNRRTLLKTLPAAASSVLASQSVLASPSVLATPSAVRLTLSPAGQLKPLQQATLQITGPGWQHSTLVLLDGGGREYLRQAAASPCAFSVGGALGRQTVRLLDHSDTPIAQLDFDVDCTTELTDEGGVYRQLLEAVLWTMMSWNNDCPVSTIPHNGRVHQFFANWIFDHTLILKGMKYFWPEVQSAIDFFAETQREDGMIWENCYPSTPDPNFFDWKFNYAHFTQKFGDGFWQLRRAPVEGHVEQYFVEGLYATWKATGDLPWMESRLDNAIRALRQIQKSPYRWSEKYQLMHRGFTIDTWDYVSDDQQRFGHSVFMVYLGKSEFGIFHGDNTNLILQSRNLAEMLKIAGRAPEAAEFEKLANDVEQRLNALSWNGQFYTHWIAENPEYKPDVGVDMATQVSLGNAYNLNRGISHEKAVAILKTYQRIRAEMPPSSPGEFYGIYPPFERDFTLNIPGLVWEYCNGGALTVVGGELARGAFLHGFESYGADILLRIKAIADRYKGYLPVALRGKAVEAPQRTFRQVDIGKQANASHGNNPGQIPLWSDQPDLTLADLPTGQQQLQAIPFEVLNPAPAPSAIVVSRQSPYAQSVTLPIAAKAESIYLLNAASGRDSTMLLTFHYADGSSHTEDFAARSWAFPSDTQYAKAGPRTQDTYRIAWKQTTPDDQQAGVYASGINNPHPDREIASLELSSPTASAKWLILAVTLSSAPVFFAPFDDLSTGIPDGWTGSVLYALFEGLAGIVDTGAAFSHTAITPRWTSAQVQSAEITLRYPASNGYCSYSYKAEQNKITLDFTGSAQSFNIEILLPPGRQAKQVRLNQKSLPPKHRTIEQSTYVVLPAIASGLHHLEVDLTVEAQ